GTARAGGEPGRAVGTVGLAENEAAAGGGVSETSQRDEERRERDDERRRRTAKESAGKHSFPPIWTMPALARVDKQRRRRAARLAALLFPAMFRLGRWGAALTLAALALAGGASSGTQRSSEDVYPDVEI